VGEGTPFLPGGPRTESKPNVKVLRPIRALVWNMRRIVNHDIECFVPERHSRIVTDDWGAMSLVYVHSNNRALASSPKATAVDGSIENQLGAMLRIELQETFKEFGILSLPDRGKRLVGMSGFGFVGPSVFRSSPPRIRKWQPRLQHDAPILPESTRAAGRTRQAK